jgi:hypothetical protein
MKHAFFTAVCVFLMVTLTWSQTISAYSNTNIEWSNNNQYNETVISDGIEKIYTNGKLIHSRPAVTDAEKLETEIQSKRLVTDYITQIINNDSKLENFYADLVYKNTPIQDIPTLLLEQKDKNNQNAISLSNSTVEKIQKEKTLHKKNAGESNTYGFAPTTKGANWNTILYDDFEDATSQDAWEDYRSSGTFIEQNGVLSIDTHQQGNKYSYGVSYDLDLYTANSYENMFYCMSVDFKLLGAGNNHWVYLMLNEQVEVLINWGYDVGCYDTSYHQIYDGLTTTDWYTIIVFYSIDASQYKTILYKRATMEQLGSTTSCNRLHTNAANYLLIGETENGGDNFAYIAFDNVRVVGISQAKFFENFDHGFWYDWRVQMTQTSFQNLYVDNKGDLAIDTTDTGLANSAPIDYDWQNNYNIVTRFKIVDSDNYWMRIIDNGPVSIFVTGADLKYYNSGGETTIWTLTTGKWNLLEAKVTATSSSCQYQIFLNDPHHIGNPAVVNCATMSPPWSARDYLRTGNGVNAYGNIRMVFLKLMGSIPTGGASDGMSNTFEDYPKTQIYGDDIESLWSNENSYEKYTSTSGGTIRWKRGDAKEGSNPHCSAGSSQCYYINPSGDTSAETQELWTPAIYVVNLPAKDIVLKFEQWYKIKNGDIASIILSKSNSWSTLRQNIQVIQAPTGDRDSGGWLYLQSITIPSSTWGGYNYIRIGFRLYTNGDSNYYLGWFIDDLKIYATLSDSSQGSDPTDTDQDGLNDGKEYYILGSSPIRTDSDEDGLSDYNEWSLDHLNNPMLEEGQANASTPDIFVEIDKMNHGFAPEARAHIILVFKQHHITIHFNTISPFNANNAIPSQGQSGLSDCEAWQNSAPPNTVYFDSTFLHAYHYMCLARNDYYPYTLYGDSINPGDHFIVFDTRCDSCSNSDYIQQGQVTMHELGHNMGLIGSGAYQEGNIDAMQSGCWGNSNNYDYLPDGWEKLGFGNALSTIEHQ